MSKGAEEAIIEAIEGEAVFYNEVIEEITEKLGDHEWDENDQRDFTESFRTLIQKNHVKFTNIAADDPRGSQIFQLTDKGFSRLGRIGRRKGYL